MGKKAKKALVEALQAKHEALDAHQRAEQLWISARKEKDAAEAARQAALADKDEATAEKKEAFKLARVAEQTLSQAEGKIARANTLYETAREQIQSVSEARAHRDNSHRQLSILQSEILGVARSFGFQTRTKLAVDDCERALSWLAENLQLKTIRSDEELEAREAATAKRILHFRLLAELEAALESGEDSNAPVRELLPRWNAPARELLSRWRAELGIA